MRNLTAIALNTARRHGASYADVRIIETRAEDLTLRNGELGDVQQEEVTKGFGTYEGLRYTVHVELDLRGLCEETTYDTASNISYRVWQTAGPMVSGDIDYVLEGYDLETDTYTTLMDFTMVLATDQIIIATAYIDPGAS